MSSPRGSSQQELAIFADRIASSVPRSIGASLSLGDNSGSNQVRRRWGIVTAFDTVSGRVDVRIDGVVIPGIPNVSWYKPIVGETVAVEYAGNDQVCTGPVGFSKKNSFASDDHVHSASFATVVKKSNEPNNTNAATVWLLGADIAQATQVNIELAGNQYQPEPTGSNTPAVSYTLGAPGTFVAPTTGDFPEGQPLRFRFRTRSKGRRVQLRPNAADYEFTGWGATYFDMYKDQIRYVDTVWDKDLRRWVCLNFIDPVAIASKRPIIVERQGKSELGPTVNFTGPYYYGFGGTYTTILIQTRSGTEGAAALKAPSGTFTDWTLIASVEGYRNNTSIRVAMKIWARRGAAVSQPSIIANCDSGSTNAFLYTISGAAMPQAADAATDWWSTGDYQPLKNGTTFPSPDYDCLFLFAGSLAEMNQELTRWWGGLGSSGITGIALDPLFQRLNYNGNYYHHALTGARYHDVPGPTDTFAVGPASGVNSVAVLGGLNLRPG